jgi:hypothetical protein
MGLFGKSKKEKAQDLMATGSKGVGTVVSVRDTGTTINDNPRVEMVFRVEPLDGSPAMDLTKKTTVSRVEIPRQGDRYPVWYDPGDTETWAYATVADDSGRESLRQMFGAAADSFVGMGTPAAPAPAGGAGQDVAAQLTQLADLKSQGLLTDEEFEAQKAKLLGS